MKTISIVLFTLLLTVSNAIITDYLKTNYPASFLTASPTFELNHRHTEKREISSIHRDIHNDQDIKNFFNSFYTTHSLSAGSYSVSVVRNGSIVYTSGFGGDEYDENTIYCAASVSKSFTAAAILQLVQQGKLDLNADIKTYVPDFKTYGPYDDVITVGDLLTHTAGFEERQPYTIVRELDQLDSLEDFVKKRMPPKRWETGTLASYSNHAFVLAGYIIEKVSGVPYNTYMKEHILSPLNMDSSSFDVTEIDQTRVAPEYTQGVELNMKYYINIGPAGGLFTTVKDLSHFIIAKLNNGTFDNNEILSPEYNKLQYSEAYSNGVNIPGIGYGFYFYNLNGKKIVNHDGDMLGYTASLWFVPEEDFGVVVLQNSKANIRTTLMMDFMDSFFPASIPSKEGTSPEIAKAAGSFADTRTDKNSYCSLINTVFGSQLSVSYLTDTLFLSVPGTLISTNDMGNMSFSLDLTLPAPVMSFKGNDYEYMAALSPISTFQRQSEMNTAIIIVVFSVLVVSLITSCAHCCCSPGGCCNRKEATYVEFQGSDEKKPTVPYRTVTSAFVIGLPILNVMSTVVLGLTILLTMPLFNPNFTLTVMMILPYILVVGTVGGLILFIYALMNDIISTMETITLGISLVSSTIIIVFLAFNNIFFSF